MNLYTEIKKRLNIVDVIRNDGYDLRCEGGDRYVCRCPFHDERTPSFKISEKFQNYKCFGCGESGDVISYYAKQNGLEVRSAATLLAEKLGISVTDEEKNSIKKRQRFLDIIKYAESYFKKEFELLPDTHPAKVEILKRGLRITDSFGYAPVGDSLIKKLKEKGYTVEELTEVGLLTDKGYPLFRNRLIFFIRGYMGNTIGFTGRSLEAVVDGWKYVNSKASIIYDKKNAFYGIEKAKKKASKDNVLYIVEGQFDVEAMWQKDYENTVALSGTAFSKEHILLINRMIKEDGKVVLLLDSDKAGIGAMTKIFKENKTLQNKLYTILLKSGTDPCEYLQRNDTLPKEKKTVDMLFDMIKGKYSPTKPKNRLVFIEKVKEVITNHISDTILKEVYLKKAHSLAYVTYNDTPVTVKEKGLPKKSIPTEDSYYVNAIALYLLNKSVLGELSLKGYPRRYHELIREINEKNNNTFIPDEYTNTKLAECVARASLDMEDIPTDVVIGHYETLLNAGHKETKRKLDIRKQTALAESLEGLSSAEILMKIKEMEEEK